MSKMDNLRAMREAKYAKARAAARTTTAAPSAPKARVAPATPATRAAPAPAIEPTVEPAGERLCGHKNMSGRTCTREHGHAAKSHRYS